MLRLALEAGQEIIPAISPLEEIPLPHHVEYLQPGLLVL